MLKKSLVRATVAAAAATIALSMSASLASAGGDYPPNTDPPEERTLDVSAFAPVCQNDVPYIQYEILPVGFSSLGPATLTIFDINGDFVEEFVVQSLSGQFLYPGATVDSEGHGTDWPGWFFDGDEWVPDTSDAILRDGLTIQVEVNPTATAAVSYPPATSACASPENPEEPSGADDPDEPTSSSSSGVLPSTGSNATMITLIIGAGLLGAGIVTSVAMRRRHAVPNAD
ncbi:LPXTG cell wall anchor domain-containing protein [Ilumatobacter nonamiensis]|uniref:LPXTG cell wall anchor domain-containing protein n=1 Tax=Ilumatobacter nonamiensis TaxID=467093 RepID=UPI0011D1A1C8|nr:LPXTG cell wall anchor domain-containing protein [Ilumatobacter nonamiensis]